MTNTTKLTQFSHGAGCGCKISPAVLHDILKDSKHSFNDPRLLVGNEDKDDAAVLDIGNGLAVISTTDFFMPIVDDPFDFGRIAAVNAISDIYAMGGSPALALSILGWPIDKLSSEVAKEVIEGGRSICKEAGISLAGGHSIDNVEPIFGLAVTGFIKKENIKKNSSAKAGSSLYLTKPLGVGILTTAKKKSVINEHHFKNAVESMLCLNKVGEEFSKLPEVLALTDVTGFGLIGHLREICEASLVSARINLSQIPLLPAVDQYIEQGCIPGGTRRNWQSYGHLVSKINERAQAILADPQTSGGLLVVVEKDYEEEFYKKFSSQVSVLTKIGELVDSCDVLIEVL